MKSAAFIKKISVKIDADTNVQHELTVLVDGGSIGGWLSLLKKPLILDAETSQMEFGTGKPPAKKGKKNA